MLRFLLGAFLFFTVLSPSAVLAENCDSYEDCLKLYLPYAVQLNVSDLDPRLPDMTLGKWLAGTLGEGAEIHWDINDCGENSGQGGQDEDMPVCAEVDAYLDDGREVLLWFVVGTVNGGVADNPGLFFGVVGGNGGKDVTIKSLGELPAALRQTAPGPMQEI